MERERRSRDYWREQLSEYWDGGLYMPSEPHGEGDIAVELWKKLEPGEK